MKQWLNPLSVNPRLFWAGSIRKALRTIHRTAVRGIRVSTNSSHTLTASETLALDSTDYVGAFLFHGNNFDKYLFDGGYVTYSGSTPSLHFYLHDHQGNNRAVAEFATLSHVNASLSQTTYYYPYGGVFGDLGSYPESQPYKYNGKELDRMHGLDWYDYGARQYDPAIARFTSMDPLAEKYYHISPYAYCAGNPVNYVDPDGREIWISDGINKPFQYSIGMDVPEKDYGFVKLLNEMATVDGGKEVLNDLISSKNKYTYTAEKPVNGDVASFEQKSLKFKLGNLDTDEIAHETFHAYQYEHGQKGKTAVREVEARLYAAKMNQEIDGWNYYAYAKIFGSNKNTYSDAMANLLNGYSQKDFSTAVKQFLNGGEGSYYKKCGYYEGTIGDNPLIKKFLIK